MRAVKDIVTTKWPGIELQEAKTNADLLTDDLKKTRWSNESFLFIGRPETTVLFYLSLPTESRAADAARHIDSLGGFIVECRDADAG